MNSNAIASVIQTAEPKPQEGPTTGSLGREDFLKMLIAQLENQDPLNPQDATAFSAQLAQFSSLEQLISIREGIGNLAKSGSAPGLSELAGLIGREIVAEGTQVEIAEGAAGPIAFDVSLAAPAADVRVDVVGPTGRVVRSLSLGFLQQGLQPVEWDGLDELGQSLAPGVYDLRVETAGDAGDATTFVRGRVTAAILGVGDASSVLLMGTIPVPIEQVVEIRQAEDSP